MRRLYISIILTVIGSLFIITWGLDKIVAKQESEQVPDEYAIRPNNFDKSIKETEKE